MRKLGVQIALSILVALGLTMLSAAYQRMGPYTGIYGNHCGSSGMELCEDLVLTAGFPLPFLVDNPCCSVRYRIGLFEDDGFLFEVFLLDIGLFSMLLWGEYFILQRLMRRRLVVVGDGIRH
jgi:hypothetical protein